MGDDRDEVDFDTTFISNEKFFDMFMKLDAKVDGISETLNNGLKSEVQQNSEELCDLKDEVDSLESTVEESANVKRGKKERASYVRERIAWILAVLANLALILVKFNII